MNNNEWKKPRCRAKNVMNLPIMPLQRLIVLLGSSMSGKMEPNKRMTKNKGVLIEG